MQRYVIFVKLLNDYYMYFRPPKFFKRLLPELNWHMEDTDAVYLTFDDGPNPLVTPWVMEQLDKYDAKATFFCIGKNAEQYPEIVQQLRDRGHSIGNHSYSHTKTIRLDCELYVEDVDMANEFLSTNLFRPPYGRVGISQIRRLSERYKIIMWDILSRDYSAVVSPEKCVKEVIPHLRGGSIIVFHDSLKASRNLYHALPIVLEAIRDKGLKCKSIEL